MKISFYTYSKIGVILLVISVFYIFTSQAFAAGDYVGLVGIPGITGKPTLPVYINNLYKLTIAIGVLIAIIRIAFAGVKYSMSGVVTDKASAKKDIQGVLLGLAILLLPALVLGTINPDLLRLNFLDNLQKITLPVTAPSGTTNPVPVGSSVQSGDTSKTLADNIAACKGTYNPATNVCYLYVPGAQ